MNKDVIYIDVEDDVTAIIGKIKASKEKIIALVPPKHAGVLQSAVNLRLLERMAHTGHKRLVLITNNQALIALSAAAGIPVAKNLQSKPELAEISALSVDDDDDIIDGAHLPVGELAKTADIVEVKDGSVDDALETIDIDDDSPSNKKVGAVATRQAVGLKKSGLKVPNFNSFRKKLFLGIAGLVLLVAFLVWANIFAPAATVIVKARTTPTAINATVTLAGNAATDVSKGLIQSSVQQSKQDISVEFEATGQKNIGEKATGSVNFSNNSVLSSKSVPAGTELQSSSGLVFVTDATVSVPSTTFPCGNFTCPVPGSASGTVTAKGEGTTYNGASGNLSGEPDGISATFAGSTSGGTDKVAKVVSETDIQLATNKIKEQPTGDAKKALIGQFTNGEVVIDDSFVVDYGTLTSVPALNTEATSGKAKLTSNVTYTISAIAKADLQLYLKADLDKQLASKDDQKVYNDGLDEVKLSGYNKTGETSTVKIISIGRIGPKIEEAQIEDQVKGKIFGDVQSSLLAIDGVSDVEVRFSFPWVTRIPNDVNKIDVRFELADE